MNLSLAGMDEVFGVVELQAEGNNIEEAAAAAQSLLYSNITTWLREDSATEIADFDENAIVCHSEKPIFDLQPAVDSLGSNKSSGPKLG